MLFIALMFCIFSVQPERELFLNQCIGKLKERGSMYFTVFSNQELTFRQGQGNQAEYLRKQAGTSGPLFH